MDVRTAIYGLHSEQADPECRAGGHGRGGAVDFAGLPDSSDPHCDPFPKPGETKDVPMKRCFRRGILPLMCGLALLVSSCAEGTPFPNTQIRQVDPSIRISSLMDSPEDFLGKTVILGGVINMVERTGIINRVYVQTYPLGKNYLPDLGRPPKGHFMIITDHPLQLNLYSPGRTVEVIGMVQPPQKMLNLAGNQEKIPVIRARYLHIQSPDPPRSSGMGMGFGFMPVMGF